MKKFTILLLALIGFTTYGQAQTMNGRIVGHTESVIFDDIPCGTWVKLPQEITDWQTVDTLGDKKRFDTAQRWVYDEERLEPQIQWTNAVYSPCGFGYPVIYEQYRIDAGTGIRQVRQRIIRQKYVEPEKSEYENVVDSLTPKVRFLSLYDTLSLHTVADSISAIISSRRPTIAPQKKKTTQSAKP